MLSNILFIYQLNHGVVKGPVTHKRKSLDIDLRLMAKIVFVCLIYC